MKLFLNSASPYARLIRVLLIETAQEHDTKLVMVDPWDATAELIAANPAAKIPALSLEDGTNIVESSCIADYLILRADRPELAPVCYDDAPTRLEILGLGRAAIDCAFGVVVQQRFASSSPLANRWRDALPRIAVRLDELYGKRVPSSDCDHGDLTVAVAFDYIDFRLATVDWRSGAEHLVRQVETVTRRQSFIATRPQ